MLRTSKTRARRARAQASAPRAPRRTLASAAHDTCHSVSPSCATYAACTGSPGPARLGLTCAAARSRGGMAATGSGYMRSKVRNAMPLLAPTAARLGRMGLTATAYTLGTFFWPGGSGVGVWGCRGPVGEGMCAARTGCFGMQSQMAIKRTRRL